MEDNKKEEKTDGRSTIVAQSVKRNFGYQTFYQIIVLVIPFIVAPFLTRWFGSEALGSFNYAGTYSTYFTLLAGLGIGNYGVRLVASKKNDPTGLRKSFWSLYVMHIFVASLALAFYILFAFFFPETNQFYFIAIITVAAAIFDTTWLFTGLENFRRIVVCNLIVKLVATTLVFVFIRKPSDIYLYAYISAGGTILPYLLLLPWIVRHIKPIKITFRECTSHLKPLLTLFVGVVAITIYTVFDKTLLGLFGLINEVAYYNYADKIIEIVKMIINVSIIVSFPRVCALVEEGKEDEAKKYVDVCTEFISLIGIGAMAGLLALGKEIAVIYYGPGFAASGVMLMWMSVLPYLVGTNNIRVSLYMVPHHKDALLTLTYVAAAALNVGSSVLFIYLMGFNGVIVGSIIAEASNFVVLSFFSRKFVSIKKTLLTLVPYLLCGGLMFLVLFLIQKVWPGSVIQMLTIFAIGLLIYLLLSCAYLFFMSPQKAFYLNFLKKFFHFSKK